jgi:predicted nuclease with TOPRIM domain
MLRTGVLCCALAGVLGLAVGCNFSAEKAIKPRDEAAATLKTTFDDLDKKVTELKEKMEKATGDEKARLEAKWKESSGKRDAAKKKLEELKTAAADKWEAVKKQADAAFGEFKKAVE